MILKAPWSVPFVKLLEQYQTCDFFHPYTCGNGSHTLTPTVDGFICKECAKDGIEYKQDWCDSSCIKSLVDIADDPLYKRMQQLKAKT